MNKNTLQTAIDNRKALHENNLSREGVKFLAKDFREAWSYGAGAPINTSVRYKIATEEGFGRAEYIKVNEKMWRHQESNVSAEVGYPLSDEPKIHQIDGKCYLNGDKNLEILEIEFFLPQVSEGILADKNQTIQDILSREKTTQAEINSIKNMGERIRERRANGDFLPSNEEMIRRAKYLANARAKNQKTEESTEKATENSANEIDVQKEIDALKNMGNRIREKREN